MNQPVGERIVLRAAHVHDRNRHAGLSGSGHDRRGGEDFECRSDHPQLVRALGGADRAFHCAFGQHFAEIHDVRLEQPVARHVPLVRQAAVAVRVGFFVEARHDVRRVVLRMALHAVRCADGAVQIDDLVRAVAGLFVQRVEVLRGDEAQHAGFLQVDERVMRLAGFRVPYRGLLLPAPRIFPCRFVGQEGVDVVHLHLVGVLGPYAIGATEVRDSCGCGDAGPGEDHDLFLCHWLLLFDLSMVCLCTGLPRMTRWWGRST